MSERGKARKNDAVECPVCNRYVGYWPDKLNPYRVHLMRHRMRRTFRPESDWCEGTERNG